MNIKRRTSTSTKQIFGTLSHRALPNEDHTNCKDAISSTKTANCLGNEQSTSFQSLSPSRIKTQLEDWISLVHDIVESVNAAIAVLNDLIDYDKIDSGTMSLQLEPLPVWRFVETSIHPFIVPARTKDIDMDIQWIQPTNVAEEKSLLVLADRVKLSQVFRNLVSNALKFTCSGGHVKIKVQPITDEIKDFPESIQASTNAVDRGDQLKSVGQFEKYQRVGNVEIRVSDSGAGMSSKTAVSRRCSI